MWCVCACMRSSMPARLLAGVWRRGVAESEAGGYGGSGKRIGR